MNVSFCCCSAAQHVGYKLQLKHREKLEIMPKDWRACKGSGNKTGKCYCHQWRLDGLAVLCLRCCRCFCCVCFFFLSLQLVLSYELCAPHFLFFLRVFVCLFSETTARVKRREIKLYRFTWKHVCVYRISTCSLHRIRQISKRIFFCWANHFLDCWKESLQIVVIFGSPKMVKWNWIWIFRFRSQFQRDCLLLGCSF